MDLVVVELIQNHEMSAEKAVRLVKRSKLRKVFQYYPEEQFHQPISAAANEILENSHFAGVCEINRKLRRIVRKKKLPGQ